MSYLPHLSRFSLVLTASAGALALSLTDPGAADSTAMRDREPAARASAARASTAGAFVANLGQWDHGARFVSSSGPMTLFLEERGWMVDLAEPRAKDAESTRAHAFRMRFDGSFSTPRILGEGRLRAHHNYFLGADATRWRTGVPLYQSVLYEGLYRGIDVRMRYAEGHPEYDLLLAPSADLGRVSVHVDGADGLRLAGDGSLVIETELGPVVQPAPLTWQTTPWGDCEALPCRYVLLGADRFGFEVEGRDDSLQLTIDPGLVYLRLLGTPGNEAARAVDVDENGFTVIAGYTDNWMFPATPGAYDRTHNGNRDTFVSGLDPNQVTGPFSWSGQPNTPDLVWSTFLGGSADDHANQLTVDDQGVITLTGETASADFPVTGNAYDPFHNGGRDVYVVRLDPSQSGAAQLVYSSFLGGSSADVGWELDVDENGVITLAGDSLSPEFPTTPGAFQGISNGRDAFVARLDPSLAGNAQLVYCTFLGGKSYTVGGFAYSLSTSGDVITIAGFTDAIDFPTTAGAFGTASNGGFDAFVSQLDVSQTGAAQLVYSTFLGAQGDEIARSVSTEGGVITVTGWTGSAGFPTTANAFDATLGGQFDAYVAQLDPTQTGSAQLVYSTFLGGAKNDAATSLVVDSTGVVTLTGRTKSPDFPTTAGAAQETFAGGPEDAFAARLDPQRTGNTQLLYSTFVGGEQTDQADELIVSESGLVAIVGMTQVEDTLENLTWEGFAVHLDMLPTGAEPHGVSSPGCTGPLALSVTSMPQVGNAGFALLCNNAPPSAPTGFVILSKGTLPAPFVLLGANLWVDVSPPVIVLSALSGPGGAAEVPIPIPANPVFAGAAFAAQFLWAGPSTPPSCPLLGFSSSNALNITIQP